MSNRRYKREILAKLAKTEIKKQSSEPGTEEHRFNCNEDYCPFLENVRGCFASNTAAHKRTYLEVFKISDLVPEKTEYSEDTIDSVHQIARIGLKKIGCSYGLHSQSRDPLNDSGMHIVKNPGFGYED